MIKRKEEELVEILLDNIFVHTEGLDMVLRKILNKRLRKTKREEFKASVTCFYNMVSGLFYPYIEYLKIRFLKEKGGKHEKKQKTKRST